MSRAPLLLCLALPLSLFALVPGPGLAQVTFDSDIQILQRLAEERYAEGDLQRAADLYREIAAKQTDDKERAKALFTAAWLLHLAGDRSQPANLLQESLGIEPSQPFDPSLYDRDFEIVYRQSLDLALRERARLSADRTEQAIALLEAGRKVEARNLLDEALALDPDNPTTLYNLAVLELEAGATAMAQQDLERVVSLTYKKSDPGMANLRARSLVGIGIVYQQQDRDEDAAQSFLEATRVDPGEVAAWKHLGILHYTAGQFALAVDPLERAAEISPNDRQIAVALTRSLAESDDAGGASALLTGYLRRHPNDAELWQQLAELEQSRMEPGAAAAALRQSIEADGENRTGAAVVSAVRLARLHLQQGDLEAAQERANQALGWDRSDADAWSVLGEAQLAAGQLASATASLARAAELEPTSSARQIALGDALLAADKLPQAESAFARAQSLDPGSAESSTRLATVRSRLDNERAIVAGRAKPRKPVPPKKIGLEFAGIDYKDLQLRGALVKQVKKKSPAARAGLRKGDLVLWIGDYAVVSDKDFMQFLKRNPPGKSLGIEYLRDGRIHDAEIRLR